MTSSRGSTAAAEVSVTLEGVGWEVSQKGNVDVGMIRQLLAVECDVGNVVEFISALVFLCLGQ